MSITTVAPSPSPQFIPDYTLDYISLQIDFPSNLVQPAKLKVSYQFPQNPSSSTTSQNIGQTISNFLKQIELSPILTKIYEDRTFSGYRNYFVQEIYLINF